jgi:O-acetyl-ADP-ribose deacetylase (regulator of RNase III)
MDGGIDALYSQRFGWKVQERLQGLTRARHYAELLVGAAQIVPTDDAAFPFIIAAPTMRVPMILRVSVHPFLAARAAILLVRHGVFSSGPRAGQKIADFVETVAFPGLGTGVGGRGSGGLGRTLALDRCALFDRRASPATWADAQARHQQLYADRIRD